MGQLKATARFESCTELISDPVRTRSAAVTLSGSLLFKPLILILYPDPKLPLPILYRWETDK